MSRQLRVDFDVLDQTIRVYGQEVEKFGDARTGVTRALEALKASGWDSAAAGKWYSMIDDDWLESMRYHMRVIGELKAELSTARDAYEALMQERDQLADLL